MAESECPHTLLKKQIVGISVHHKCTECPQKFIATKWSGKMEAFDPSDASKEGNPKP